MRSDNINNKEPWLGKMKEKFEDYSEPAPTFGWEQLEKELIATKPTRVFFMKKNWAIAAAAALIGFTCAISLHLLHTPQVETMQQVAIKVIEQNQDVLLPTQEPKHNMEVAQATPINKTTISSTTRPSVKASVTAAQNDEVISSPSVEDKTCNDQGIESDNQIQSSSVVAQESANQPKDNAQERRVSKPSSKDKLHLPTESGRSSKKGKGGSVGAGISNAGNFANNSNLSFARDLNRICLTNIEDGVLPIPENHTVVFNEGIPYLLASNEVINANHHQPIAAGLTFRYPLSHGLSIETGLMFTMLSSDITLASNVNQSMKQKLYYLGIPIKANWDFLTKKYFTLYLSAGGQIEKSVYGKLGDEKLNVKQVQFSVMGGVGAQFNVSNRLGIYVEPGVAYFFNDGSNVETIRKERPFNFNMQAGIRFTY